MWPIKAPTLSSPLEQRLTALAASGQTLSYGDLARDLGLRMAELTAQLEALMETDAREGRPFRAALLHQRLSPDHLPAPGFFLKAAALGADLSDPKRFVQDQRTLLLRTS